MLAAMWNRFVWKLHNQPLLPNNNSADGIWTPPCVYITWVHGCKSLCVCVFNFKHSNLILSVVYMVFLRNSIPWKRLAWSAAERAMLWTTKKNWKVSHLEIHPNAVKTASHNPYKLMGNLQHTSYCFSFVDVTLPIDASFDVVHSAMGDRKVSRSRHCI